MTNSHILIIYFFIYVWQFLIRFNLFNKNLLCEDGSLELLAFETLILLQNAKIYEVVVFLSINFFLN